MYPFSPYSYPPQSPYPFPVWSDFNANKNCSQNNFAHPQTEHFSNDKTEPHFSFQTQEQQKPDSAPQPEMIIQEEEKSQKQQNPVWALAPAPQQQLDTLGEKQNHIETKKDNESDPTPVGVEQLRGIINMVLDCTIRGAYCSYERSSYAAKKIAKKLMKKFNIAHK